ncbi:MAG: outer membrane protein transport protein [Filomicrobium sp.]
MCRASRLANGLAAILAFGAVAVVGVNSAHAGGFGIREQSASGQGASFAGAAAGNDLSSMFWNPAAVSVKGKGLNFESHYSLIVPRADISVHTLDGVDVSASPLSESGNFPAPAIVGASYGAYQLSDKLYVGVSINSPFGLTTKPDNSQYLGSVLARMSKLLTLNASPTVGYKIAPGLTVAAGFQVQYADGEFKFATGAPSGTSSGFEGDDWAFGATAGILYQPSPTTSIGLGYRSRLSHTLEGDFYTNASSLTGGRALVSNAEADINLPDIVTLSVKQAISPKVRLMGTVEWSNWSRFEDLTVTAADDTVTVFNLGPTGPISTTAAGSEIASISAGWGDGWYLSAGGEYDASKFVTMRAGVGYEISPVKSPKQRVLGIPDSNRLWLSAGASLALSESMEVDIGYTHVAIGSADFDRNTFSGTNMTGEIHAVIDILAVSLKTRW